PWGEDGAVADPIIRDGCERKQHRAGARRGISGKHSGGRVAGAAAEVFHEERKRLPGEQGDTRYLHFRAAQSAERSAVLGDGFDLLPEPADLSGADPAEPGDFAFSLCDAAEWISDAGKLGRRGIFDESFRDRRPQSPDLCEERIVGAADCDVFAAARLGAI